MRLLSYGKDDKLIITKSDDSATPSYAILSHLWGEDADEVTFADLVTGNEGHAKPGYEKVRLCGQQARRDNLQYFWIDTCCIDKTDKAELSHAIQSMFRWYQNATRCYVYLSDVTTRDRKLDGMYSISWEPAFRSSRWFTRGWTLQELLAPSIVEFFSREWTRLGDKVTVKQWICSITNISLGALEGTPLSQFSINERLRWSEGRVTKREEDRAYALQGIFDVELAPVYGEGAAGAFRRLMDEIDKSKTCIRDLHSTDPCDDKTRIEDTKGGLLADSYCWILDNNTFRQWQHNPDNRLLWIKGDPGKGKTMLLCGIIDELKQSKNTLLSYFFCQGTDSRINSATAVLRGLILLLVKQQPRLILHLRKRYDQAGASVFQDSNAWVALSDMFQSMMQNEDLTTSYLIVDALDECMVDLPMLLDFIVRTSLSTRVKWLVSSRNESHIEQRLKLVSNEAKLSLELRQNAEQIAGAVNAYIDYRLSRLQSICDDDTREQVRDELQRKSNGTFLWIALMMEELEKPESWDPVSVVKEAPAGLRQLYDRMMDQIKRLSMRNAEVCRSLLCTAAVAYRPIYLAELGSLHRLPGRAHMLPETVRKVVGMCGSFLTVRDEQVYLVHQSAKDYLSEQMRAATLPPQNKIHYYLSMRSIGIMSSTLKRDMYGLVAPGFSIEDAEAPDPDPLSTARYSCLYWIDHLQDSKYLSDSAGDLKATGAVEEFLRTKYLYWLEGLSLCRSMSRGATQVAELCSLAQAIKDGGELLHLLQDSLRFILYHRVVIEHYPLQTYVSALLFSPTESAIRQSFVHELPTGVSIHPAMSANWSACLQTLEDHTSAITSITFSHDSTKLASASHDDTIKLWASSGECLRTIEGHGASVWSVAFSHDSTKLASGGDDAAVRVWDVSSGKCLQLLKGHSRGVSSVAFSHDSTRIASASFDSTVKIWAASSGECLKTIETDSEISSIALSHDSTKLACASDNGEVRIWNTRSGNCLQILRGNRNWIGSVAFSHDSTKLASASSNQTIKVWETNSGVCLQSLKGHSDSVGCIAFSHQSTKLVSASRDKTMKIWNVSSGECLQTFEGHRDWVSAVAVSRDSNKLASASWEGTIKMWETNGSEGLQTIKGYHDKQVNSVAFSHDATKLASASADGTVKVLETGSGVCLHTLECHSSSVRTVSFSHDSMKLASGSHDKTIKIWDASSGKCLQTFRGHRDWVVCVVFSRDSSNLASSSFDYWIKIWNVSSGACLRTLEGHSNVVTSMVFSHDSSKLVSLSLRDSAVMIWDTGRGTKLQTLAIDTAFCMGSPNITSILLPSIVDIIVVRRALRSIEVAVVDPKQPQSSDTSLNHDTTWITHKGKNMVWIPAEHRPLCAAMFGTSVGIGTVSSGVWICNFDQLQDQ